jgi:hypothetical protein
MESMVLYFPCTFSLLQSRTGSSSFSFMKFYEEVLLCGAS